WLNDPYVNQYSGRKKSPTDFENLKNYLNCLPKDAFVLAICLVSSGMHIGNIKYGPIDWPNRCCEIEIIIGEKGEWGKGYGSEAIYLVSKHLFQNVDMNRVEAKSVNPGFACSVTEKLGWSQEGELRERFFCGGKFINYSYFSI
ncbi:MAG: GNAT family N-acetyltransferase, partial [Desulfamplus sp.]|nr:GNAT family N-acetyltransferase [Desulfamplus sp.]